MKVTGKRAVLALKAALEAAGLPRTSALNGGAITGWTRDLGSTGFSVAPQAESQGRMPTGRLDFHVVVSGRAHMRYRSWRRSEGSDGSIDLHEPTNPDVVIPRVREAARSVGLKVLDVRYSGCSNHWDDDVDFNVITETPDWIEAFDATNAPSVAGTPILVAVSARYDAIRANVGALAGYVTEGRTFLTVESVTAMAEAVAKRGRTLADAGPARSREAPPYAFELSGDVLVATDLGRHAPGRVVEARRTTLTNAWGDDVDCWPVQARAFARMDEFKPTVPFVVEGRHREALDFAEHDAQFGEDAPWSRPLRAATMTP